MKAVVLVIVCVVLIQGLCGALPIELEERAKYAYEKFEKLEPVITAAITRGIEPLFLYLMYCSDKLPSSEDCSGFLEHIKSEVKHLEE